MRQRLNPVARGFRWLSLFLLLMFVLSSVSCLQTRGAMYLQKRRVGVYLSKTDKSDPPKGVDFSTYLVWRGRLNDMPDGNRILGGFCTEEKVLTVLKEIDGLRPTCQKRLYRRASAANLQGRLFWGFLGSTLGAGAVAIGMGAGALAVTDTGAKNALGIVAAATGTAALLTALINGFGGFDARQEKYKIRTYHLDNFMWSLRQRVIVEVCNAKNRGTAIQQIVYIYNMTQQYCAGKSAGDGSYYIPTGGAKFDSKTLPDALPAQAPPKAPGDATPDTNQPAPNDANQPAANDPNQPAANDPNIKVDPKADPKSKADPQVDPKKKPKDNLLDD